MPIQRSFLNVYDAEFSGRFFSESPQRDERRRFDCEGGTHANAEIAVMGVKVGLGQLISWQFFPKIDDGVVEFALTILAVSSCEVLPFLSGFIHFAISPQSSKISLVFTFTGQAVL